MVPLALRAADDLAADDIEVEVLDLRCLRPLDTACVLESVQRTGHLVTVHEAWVTAGIGAEIVAAIAETCPSALRSAAIRLGAAPVPIPSGKVRPHALPNVDHIIAAVRRAVMSTTLSPDARES